MEAFNPYRAWLGVMSNSEPPNHYELLGLRMLRAEPADVAEAFQRQVSRLSVYLPGEHASTAQRILSELATAKVELLTPTTKRIYDAKLAAGKRSVPRQADSVGTAPKPSGSDSVASDDWLPPAADPTLASSYAPGASSAIPVMPEPVGEPLAVAPMNQPLPPPNQPLPPTHQPLPQAPMTVAAAPATAMPIYGYQQPYGQVIPTAATPYYGGYGPSMPIASAPYGTPTAAVPLTAPAPILYAQAAYNSGQVCGSGQECHTGMSAVAVANQESYASAHAVGAPATSVAARGRFQRQSSPVPIVAGVLLAGVLIVAVGIYAVKSASGPVAAKPSTQQNSQEGSKKVGGKSPGSTTKPPRQREPRGQTEPDDQPRKPRLSDQPWPPKGDPDKVEQPDPASKTEPDMSDSAVADPKMSDAAKPEPTDPEAAKADAAKSDPDTPSSANPDTAKPDTKPDPANPDVPATPEPVAPPPEATAKQAAAVKRALTAARAALGKRDLETVKEQLDLATLDAVTPDLDAEVARVQRLEEYVELFWKAVSETLPKLEVGEEFTVNGVVGGVVEGTADMLVIRAQGRNREYSLYEIPTTLAVMLAERWLDKTDKNTPVVIGAFLLADPKGDDQEARRLFEQGADRGVDVAPLLKELEDRKNAG